LDILKSKEHVIVLFDTLLLNPPFLTVNGTCFHKFFMQLLTNSLFLQLDISKRGKELKKIVTYLIITLLILQVCSGLGLAFAKNVPRLSAIDEQSQLQSASIAQTGSLIQSQNVVANVSSTPTSLANNTGVTNYIGPAGIETPLETLVEPDGKAQETLAQPCGPLIHQSSNNTSPAVATNSCTA
jgi:hypothetical protein